MKSSRELFLLLQRIHQVKHIQLLNLHINPVHVESRLAGFKSQFLERILDIVVNFSSQRLPHLDTGDISIN